MQRQLPEIEEWESDIRQRSVGIGVLKSDFASKMLRRFTVYIYPYEAKIPITFVVLFFWHDSRGRCCLEWGIRPFPRIEVRKFGVFGAWI